MTQELAAILWDMDGTLIDSESVWIGAQQQLVARFGGTWTEADGLTLVGASMAETALAMRRAGVTIDPARILASLERDVAHEFRRHIIWEPGVIGLVRELHSNGVPQAIVTTSPSRLATLVAKELSGYGRISVVVTGDDVTQAKPDPEGYLLAARLLGVNITECVAIEDSDTGLRAAEASGAFSLRLTPDIAHRTGPRLAVWQSLEGRSVNDLRDMVR